MSSPRPLQLLFSLLVISAFTISGCKKKEDEIQPQGKTTSTVYDFSWSANPVAGQRITFTSTAPATSKHLWEFGEDITSTQVQPGVTYGWRGTYTVSLIVDDDVTHKITKQIVVNDAVIINYHGVPCIGDTFYCTATIAGTSYAWNFGDGYTSTDPAPAHIYTKDGNYTITLKMDNYATVSRNVTVYKDPLFTNKIAGSRIWHVTQRKVALGIDTTYTYPDETSEIVIEDKVTIRYSILGFSGLLKYNASLSQGNVLAYGTPDDNILFFDHIQDTIRIIKQDGPGKLQGPYNWTTIFRTP